MISATRNARAERRSGSPFPSLTHPAPTVSFSCSHGAWRSLVARLLWEQEVLGSNPSAPIGFGARSSAGQSGGLLSRGSEVRILSGALGVDQPSRSARRSGQTTQVRDFVSPRVCATAPSVALVSVAQSVRAPDCGSGGRGFESPRSPCRAPRGLAVSHRRFRSAGPTAVHRHASVAQLAEQGTLNPKVEGSIPSGRTAEYAPGGG